MLFRKHPPEKDPTMILRDGNNNILAESPLYKYPFEEQGIIASSIEFFKDPEPCEIHRGAVLSRSIAHFKMVCPLGEQIQISALDPLLQQLLPQNASTIELR